MENISIAKEKLRNMSLKCYKEERYKVIKDIAGMVRKKKSRIKMVVKKGTRRKSMKLDVFLWLVQFNEEVCMH